jgi:hypothetical protein
MKCIAVFSKDAKKNSEVVKFNVDWEQIHYNDWFNSISHDPVEEFLNANHGLTGFSCLVKMDPLRQDLIEDPNYCHVTNSIGACEALQDARSDLWSRRFKDDSFYLKKAKKLGFPMTETNQPGSESIKNDIIKEFFLAEERMQMYREIRYRMKMANYRYNQSTDCFEKIRSKKEIRKNKARVLREACQPTFYKTYNRIYDMPKPFNHWDSRNIFQQFFFFFDKKKKKFLVSVGSQAGSSTRANYSHFSHVSHKMSNQGSFIGTIMLTYNENNVFTFDGIFSGFYVGHNGFYSSNYNMPEIDRSIPYLSSDGNSLDRYPMIPTVLSEFII